MKSSVDSLLKKKLPGFSLGFIHYSGVSISESPKLLQGRINLFIESLRLDQEGSALQEIENIKEWRSSFKQIGIDPSRYRPSSEALLRRILQGNPFTWINTAVDVNNFLSVRYALPFGIYNAGQLSGPIICRIGLPEDKYEAINGREVNMEQKILLADDAGAFGSPIVDSVRSKVSEGATELVQCIFFHPKVAPNQREEIIGSTARMMTEINGGESVLAKVIS